MNCRNLRLRRKSVCFGFAENEEKRVGATHRSVNGIVKLCIVISVFFELLYSLRRARAQIIEPSEDDRFGRTNFCARRWEAALLAIITESTFEGAAGVGQRLRTTIDNAKRTGYDAIPAAVADIILHEHRTDFGADDRPGRTGFEAAGFFTMFADVGKKNPAEGIFAVVA